MARSAYSPASAAAVWWKTAIFTPWLAPAACDGAVETLSAVDPTTNTFTGSHQYAHSGTYAIAVTVTDAEGKYFITAPGNGVLLFNRIGYRGVGQSIGGRTTIDVALERAISVLPEVVVTGYTSQKRADITGAVAIANVESMERQTSTSVLQRLDGRVPGVTVDASGSPGSRSTVRIRGFTSFQNNDPLYIIDGTPVEDSYINWLNPNDIGSIQVLKDASAASIYGSRASNGVVIIEGLNLSDAEPGVYEMYCLPLRIAGADGAPARVVLKR